ncbi:MAG: hypothetical protein QM813_23895 [Verrucomicrobiota bacterium]
MDAIVSGKPIVVFAPTYASISRHMKDAGCGFCVQTSDACGQLLRNSPWGQAKHWVDQYHALLGHHHTPAAARRILFSDAVVPKGISPRQEFGSK